MSFCFWQRTAISSSWQITESFVILHAYYNFTVFVFSFPALTAAPEHTVHGGTWHAEAKWESVIIQTCPLHDEWVEIKPFNQKAKRFQWTLITVLAVPALHQSVSIQWFLKHSKPQEINKTIIIKKNITPRIIHLAGAKLQIGWGTRPGMTFE